MKLEVGMYIRYNGQIMKITELGYNNETFMSNGNGWFSSYNCDASHDITDLIEIGDYVNGHKVEQIWEDNQRFGGCDYMFNIDADDIKSILTKEQFESMAYKVV